MSSHFSFEAVNDGFYESNLDSQRILILEETEGVDESIQDDKNCQFGSFVAFLRATTAIGENNGRDAIALFMAYMILARARRHDSLVPKTADSIGMTVPILCHS
jgi:hypothetical protein